MEIFSEELLLWESFCPFGEQNKAFFILWNIDSSDKETFRKEGLHPFPHVPCLVVFLFRGAAVGGS